MSHFYYDFNTLENGSKQMVELIEQFYSKPQGLVHPQVKPGFLRHALPQNPPENGEPIEYLIERTKNAILPGIMNWQSPKYFGFYPSSVSTVCVLADMFAASFHTPNFSYAVAPSYTELQNTMMDWSAKALGLPDKYLIKNSGGGIMNNSASESMFVSVHVAKFKKLKQLNIQGNNPDLLKLVGYFGQGSHISSERALLVKDIYYRRSVPYVYKKEKLNYELDFDKFVEMVEQDKKQGLIPFWFGGSWGNTFSAAIDLSDKVVNFCKENKIWINIDAAFLGSTWICQEYRPESTILQAADSITVNFSKLLLTGTVCLFYVADKKIVSESFGAKVFNFAFFKNHFTQNQDIIDYKDWIVGLARRNNSLKLYYNFTHYGLNKIKQSVLSLDSLSEKLVKIVESHPDLLQIHTVKYTLVLFQVKAKDGKVSTDLTKSVAAKIKNCAEGFCTPSQFQGNYVIRIVIGNFHTKEEHIVRYINKIIQVAQEQQGKLN